MKFSNTTIVSAALLAGCLFFLSNCEKDKNLDYKYESALNLPAQPYNYIRPGLPQHIIQQQFLESEITNHGATLGRVLFYDKKLSRNNTIACASCHRQENGFADPARFSAGFDGGLTKRNASSIANLMETGIFFWDSRETDLEELVLQPVKNHVEMGMDDFEVLEKKLNSLPYYAPLFESAFGDTHVTRERIADALAQFLKAMMSGNSKLDAAGPGSWSISDPSGFSAEELAGLQLFSGKATCAGCHSLASNNSFEFFVSQADIGLEATYTSDKGMGETQPGLEGMFKVPSLRNVALSAPYMHDGRFATLMDVVNHYNSGIQPSPNLDWVLRGNDGQPIRLNLTESEKQSLVAFLHTLTDEQFVSDPKFSDPFK